MKKKSLDTFTENYTYQKKVSEKQYRAIDGRIVRVYVAGKLNDMACGYIKNLHEMIKTAEKVRKEGYSVFVPGLDFLVGLTEGDWEYEEYFGNSQPWLEASDAIFVRKKKWKSSCGTKREINHAEKRNIPVFFEIENLNRHFPLLLKAKDLNEFF